MFSCTKSSLEKPTFIQRCKCIVAVEFAFFKIKVKKKKKNAAFRYFLPLWIV